MVVILSDVWRLETVRAAIAGSSLSSKPRDIGTCKPIRAADSATGFNDVFASDVLHDAETDESLD